MPITYFKRYGFSYNEGGGPFNIHISWFDKDYYIFFYIFIIKWRFHFMWKRDTDRDSNFGE